MIKIDILYNDRYITVCKKEIGVLSESNGMPELLKNELGGNFYCVHRLDQAVSGIMVYAKDTHIAGKLSSEFGSHDVVKEYLAVIQGHLENKNGILNDFLFKDSAKNKVFVVKRPRKGVKEAELEYAVLQELDNCSLIKIKLHTGRTHQIRVQFASRKHPLLGDVKYGSSVKECPIALFSHRLCFKHPVTNKIIDFSLIPGTVYPWNQFNINDIIYNTADL